MATFQRWGDLPRAMQDTLIHHRMSSLRNVIQEAYEITRSPTEYQQVLLNMQLSGELPTPGPFVPQEPPSPHPSPIPPIAPPPVHQVPSPEYHPATSPISSPEYHPLTSVMYEDDPPSPVVPTIAGIPVIEVEDSEEEPEEEDLGTF